MLYCLSLKCGQKKSIKIQKAAVGYFVFVAMVAVLVTKLWQVNILNSPNAFLGKPYQLKGLRDTINRVLANKA